MKWFGKAYGAPYEADTEHVATPVGEPCGRCDEPIEEHDSGLVLPHLGEDGVGDRPFHYECHMRGFVGGLNHQLGRCTCCGGDQPPDPAGMSRREAARLAVKNWLNTRGKRSH